MEPITIVGDAVAGQSATLRSRLRLLAQDITRNTFDLAEAFLEAQETRCYAQWGYESIGEYAETELGVKQRKCQYLARIARTMRVCGIKRLDYEPAGLTNLRIITTLDPEGTYFNQETRAHESMAEHITELVAEAPELSTKEVEAEVNRLLGMDGENAMVHKSYSVTKSCYENTIQRCFEAVRMRLGSAGRDDTGAAKEYNDGAVLEALCAEYLADPRNFMEEPDESRVQTEVPLEETNDQASEGKTKSLPHSGGNVCGCGLGRPECTREVGTKLDSGEVPQESLQGSNQSFVIQSED